MAHLPWSEVEAEYRRNFPTLDIDMMRRRYEAETGMAAARARIGTPAVGADDATHFFSRRSIPFASSVLSYLDQEGHTNALRRIAEGTHTHEDYDTVARHERAQQVEAPRAGHELQDNIVSSLAHIPAMVGEAAVGGAALRGLGVVGQAPSMARALVSPAAWGRNALQTATMPSMWLSGATERAAQNGGDTFDPENIVPATLMGFAQTAVLGSFGHVIKGGAEGAMPFIKRLIARTGIGMGEQQVVDAVAGTVDNFLPQAYQTKTKYGTLGQFIQGDDKAWEHLAVQLVTFGTFSALHPILHGEQKPPAPGQEPVANAAPAPAAEPATPAPRAPHEVIQEASAVIDRAARSGMTKQTIAERATSVIDIVNRALEANPTMTKAETMALFEGTKLSQFQKQFLESLVSGRPEVKVEQPTSQMRPEEAQNAPQTAPTEQTATKPAPEAGAVAKPPIPEPVVKPTEKPKTAADYERILKDAGMGVDKEGFPVSQQGSFSLEMPIEPHIQSAIDKTRMPKKERDAIESYLSTLSSRGSGDALDAAHQTVINRAKKAFEKMKSAGELSDYPTFGDLTASVEKRIQDERGPRAELLNKKAGLVGEADLSHVEEGRPGWQGDPTKSVVDWLEHASAGERGMHPDLRKEIDLWKNPESVPEVEYQDLLAEMQSTLKELKDATRTAPVHADAEETRLAAALAEAARKDSGTEASPESASGQAAHSGPGTSAADASGNPVRRGRKGELSLEPLKRAAEWVKSWFEAPEPKKVVAEEIDRENAQRKRSGQKPLSAQEIEAVTRANHDAVAAHAAQVSAARRTVADGERNLAGPRNESVASELEKRGLPELEKRKPYDPKSGWEEAKRIIAENPAAGMDTVNDYMANPRGFESGLHQDLVAHEQLTTRREYDRVLKENVEAIKSGNAESAAGTRAKVAILEERMRLIDKVNEEGGTRWHDVGQARQNMVKEDFSLSRMMDRRTAYKGKPLTDAEKVEVEKLHARIKELQEKVDAQVAGGKKKSEIVGDLAELERMRDADRKENLRLEALDRPLWQRVMSAILPWRRASVLSSPVVFPKLGSAALTKMVTTPTENLVGQAIGAVIPGIRDKAVYEGRTSFAIEGKAFAEGWTRIIDDATSVIKTGNMEIDHLGGKKTIHVDESMADLVGRAHYMLKTVPKRAAFERSMMQGYEGYARLGMDVSDPVVQTRIVRESVEQANRAIFQNDNWLVDMWRKAMAPVKDPATGKETTGSVVRRTLGEIALPIVKVPTNIVFETFQHTFGLVTGATRAAHAYAKGIESLRPEQADVIMRELKKGAVGAAVLALGYFLKDSIGGYYQPGERREKDDVSFGAIKIGGWEIPPYLLHNPLVMTLQLGATIGRIAEKKVKGEEKGPVVATARALLGLVEEVPFAREFTDLHKLAGANPGNAAGDQVRGLLVPQIAQFAARHIDRDAQGELVKRKQTGFVEHVQSGVPGWRQQLEPINPDLEQFQIKMGHVNADRHNHLEGPQGRMGQVFPQEREYRVLHAFAQRITQLEHAIKGDARMGRGPLRHGSAPAAEQVLRWREMQADLARRALAAIRR